MDIYKHCQLSIPQKIIVLLKKRYNQEVLPLLCMVSLPFSLWHTIQNSHEEAVTTPSNNNNPRSRPVAVARETEVSLRKSSYYPKMI